MANYDGMIVHDGKYRVPDLLSEEEFKMYMASTYGVGIEFVELSDEMREKISGVGTLPAPTVISDRDRETMLLRKQLGLEDDGEETVKELHGRVMTRQEFADKYGPQPAIETPEEKEARLNPPKDETEEEPESETPENPETPVVSQSEDESRVAQQQSPSSALADLLRKQEENK